MICSLGRIGAALVTLAALPTVSTVSELPAQSASEIPLKRLAFGSCSHQDEPQPLWNPIIAGDPELWIWLGDNIYGDTEDLDLLSARYQQAMSDPGYQRLLASVPIIGTWDDHDFGTNNGGNQYPQRAGSQELLLDFLGVADTSPLREQKGVYTSHSYGPPGARVRVILLDTRYHRDPIGSGGAMLGEEQWAWLERELRHTDAQINIIGSSVQLIAEDHPFEKWSNFPSERDRMLELIGDSGAPGVIVLSGDRHIAEIMRLQDPRLRYPLYEVTSSGMTHHGSDGLRQEGNRHRLGPNLVALNYGTLEIDWGASRSIRLQVRGAAGELRLEQAVPLEEITPGG